MDMDTGFVLWGLGYTLVQSLIFPLFSFGMGIFTPGHCMLGMYTLFLFSEGSQLRD